MGTATAADPRSRVVKKCWIGLAVFLAYLPDFLEWVGRSMGLEMTRSAPASLFVVAICIAVLLPAMRLTGEKSAVILVVGAAAVLSHLLMDMIHGGIPLWWPVSSRKVGPDWLHLGPSRGVECFRRELVLFGGTLAVGLAIGIARCRPGAYWCAIVGGLVGLAWAASWLDRPVFVLAGIGGLAAAGLIVCRTLVGLPWLWHAVPLLPLLFIAGSHLYIGREVRLGDEFWMHEEYRPALVHYNRSRRFISVSGESCATLYKIGYCHWMMGDEAEAHRFYLLGVEKFPEYSCFYEGLAEVCLFAKNPVLNRPQEVFALTDKLVATASGTWEARVAARLVAKARQVLGLPRNETQPAAAESTVSG